MCSSFIQIEFLQIVYVSPIIIILKSIIIRLLDLLSFNT